MLSSSEKPVAKNSKVLIFENSFALSEHLLAMWMHIARESIARQNRFTVALSGGRSPMEFYSKLSVYKDFDVWSRTHVFLGDERFVPADHDSSNFKLVKENLLDYVEIPERNIHPVSTAFNKVELAADQYKDDLIGFFELKGNAPSFDLILLGVGSDGHTASLFPDDPNITDPGRLVLPVSLPHLKEDRISLGLPVINNAKNVISLLMGADKADIAYHILKENMAFPASMVHPVDGQLTFLLNKESAQKLPYRDSPIHEGQAILYEN